MSDAPRAGIGRGWSQPRFLGCAAAVAIVGINAWAMWTEAPLADALFATTTLGVIVLAVIMAGISNGRQRVVWLGFVVFSLGYLCVEGSVWGMRQPYSAYSPSAMWGNAPRVTPLGRAEGFQLLISANGAPLTTTDSTTSPSPPLHIVWWDDERGAQAASRRLTVQRRVNLAAALLAGVVGACLSRWWRHAPA